jgi:hypothetical protein
VKSFSNHVQQSPECKVFVLDQTAINAVPLRVPSKQALANTTAQLFKKQRLWLNPSFTEQQHTINVMNTHNPPVDHDASMNEDDICWSDHDSVHQSELLTEDIASVASEKSFDSEDTYGGNNVLAEDITESPVESNYSSFTTNQKCVTSG